MKITILQGAFLPVPAIIGGAVEKIWYQMGKEFAKNGYEVVHIGRSHSSLEKDETVDEVKYIRIKGYNSPKSLILRLYLDLVYSIRSKKFIDKNTDIIVTNTFWAPILFRGLLGKKVYVDVQRYPKGQMKLYKHVGCLRGNSTPVSKAIKEELPLSLHHIIDMVPNPLPFVNNKQINFENKEKILLYAGRVHPEKGIEIMLNAFKKIDSDWKLRIVGPWQIEAGGGGEQYLNKLKNTTKDLNVTIIEPIYDEYKLNREYESASVFIYPSVAEKGETFGLAPLEAMAWGCVPVVSDLDCFKDFIKHNHNGLIFNHRSKNAADDLSSKLITIIRNEQLRIHLAKKALHVNDTHSTSSIAQQFISSFTRKIL